MNQRLLFCFLALLAMPLVAHAQATVKFAGEKFPMRVTVEAEGSKEILMRPGTTKFVGKVTITAAAYPTDGYYVVARYSVNDGTQSDLVLGKHTVELRDKDVLIVHQVGILPPPNAALVPLKEGSVLVSLMYPAAIANPPDFTGEEFRSSAMFVAKYGRKAVARKLAEQALKGTAKDAHGVFRGDQQMSVIRQSNPDGTVAKVHSDVTVDELAVAIELGLLDLHVNGWHTEVMKAKDLLK